MPKYNCKSTSHSHCEILFTSMSIKNHKIHVFSNDCILFCHEYEEILECPICKTKTYRNDVVPLVWIALKNRLSATVRYLASEQPLAAYRFYASSHGDRIAKSLRQIPDLAAFLPALLGWTPNAVNETPLTAAVLSCQADMAEMLYTLRPKETREQSSLR